MTKAFADSANNIHGTLNNNLSNERNVYTGTQS